MARAAPVLLASVVLLALRRPSACLAAAACLALVAVPLPDTVDDAASVERAAANVDLRDGCVLRVGAAWCNSSMLVVSRARCRHRMRARTAIVVWRNMVVTTTTVPSVLVLSSGYIWKGRPRAMGARFALVSRAQSTKEKVCVVERTPAKHFSRCCWFCVALETTKLNKLTAACQTQSCTSLPEAPTYTSSSTPCKGM